jgi:steroid delta-isomerase-like uncharacterized protein
MGLAEWLAHHKEEGDWAMSSNRKAYERWVQLYNAGDLEGLADSFTEDAILVTPDGTAQGRAAILEVLSRDKAAFPERHVTIDVIVEQGDTIAGEWTWVGTHTGPLVMPDGTEVPPTGKPVELKGMELAQMRDGKIAVHHGYWDNMAVAQQLGLLPGEAGT